MTTESRVHLETKQKRVIAMCGYLAWIVAIVVVSACVSFTLSQVVFWLMLR